MENREVIRRFYELLLEMFQEIEDIFNEEERLEIAPYARIEILEMMKESGLENNRMIEDFIDKELRRLGLLEVRPNIKREISTLLLIDE